MHIRKTIFLVYVQDCMQLLFDKYIFGSNYCLTNIILATSSDLRLQAARRYRDGFKGGDKLRV